MPEGKNILDTIKEKARAKKQKVVLPEGTEPRVIQAARDIVAQEIAQVTILGEKAEIEKLAKEHKLDLDKVTVITPAKSEQFDEFAETFMEIRKGKCSTREEAEKVMKNELYFGAMMVRSGMVDGSVAGSVNTTGDVLRAAIQVIGLAENITVVSGAFMMTVPEYLGQKNKTFMYADGAVVPNPDAEQLASIAIATARTHKNLTGEEPKVAMLSFSTKGSAKHRDVDKIIKATEIVKSKAPHLKVDGELQVDAAIVPDIAERKNPGSEIKGDANVMIFPDLDAGNICYKITQRLANATATGPIVQGLRLPANDLSRGCSSDDIVDVTAIAMLMKG